MNLFEVSKELVDRLGRIFLRDQSGCRPVFGGTEKFQTDPHWRDNLLFDEYFHGDTGVGLVQATRPAGPNRRQDDPNVRPARCEGFSRGR